MGQLGKTDNIFVVYPSFSGGNHLINLIGLCDNVEPTWLKGKDLLTHYSNRLDDDIGISQGGMIAHYNIPDNTEANEHRLVNHNKLFKKQTSSGFVNLLQGHNHSFKRLAHFYCSDIYSDNPFDGIENVKWLMIEYPTNQDSLSFQRMSIEKQGVELLEDEIVLYPKLDSTYDWGLTELQPLGEYDKDLFDKRINQLNDIYNMNASTNAVSLDSDIYFTYEGSQLVRDILKSSFDLELPSIADEIHALWIDMIERRVDYYNTYGK